MWEILVRDLDGYGMSKHTEAIPNGVVLVVGYDERKKVVVELVKKLLLDVGSSIAVEPIESPQLFSLKCGLIKGFIQFPVIKDNPYGTPLTKFLLGEYAIAELRKACESHDVPFFFITNEDVLNLDVLSDWIKSKITIQ